MSIEDTLWRDEGHNCDLVQLGDASYNQAIHKKLFEDVPRFEYSETRWMGARSNGVRPRLPSFLHHACVKQMSNTRFRRIQSKRECIISWVYTTHVMNRRVARHVRITMNRSRVRVSSRVIRMQQALVAMNKAQKMVVGSVNENQNNLKTGCMLFQNSEWQTDMMNKYASKHIASTCLNCCLSLLFVANPSM